MGGRLEEELLSLQNEYHLRLLEDGLDHADENPTNALGVLGIRSNERRLTRFLRWLLTPDETHGLGDSLLEEFLDLCGIEGVEVRSVESFFTVRREQDDSTEIDLVLIGADACIGVEIKTTHQEKVDNLHKEHTALEQSFPGLSQHELIYLTYKPDDAPAPEVRYQTIFWSDVIQRFEDQLDAAPNCFEKALITDFIITIKTNVMTEFDGLSESTELYLQYSEAVDAARSAYESDRETILDALAASFFNSEGIGDEWERSNTYKNSYIKLFKPEWHSLDNNVNMEFEPHVNLKANGSGRDYLDDPSIRVRFDVEGREAQTVRDEILDRLGDDGERKLESEGFYWFSKDESTYKFISKPIPLEDGSEDYDPIEASVEAIHNLREILEGTVDEVAEEF